MFEPQSMLDFVIKYKVIFIFYALVILFLALKRKSWGVQNKIIILYRTKFGLSLIEKVSAKFKEWVILLGYVGVGAGYIGMVVISYVLIKNIIDLILVPKAVSGVSLVLPGINVPGMGVLPFWHWLIAIFVIAVVHEFSHGIVAKAHGISVKSTGMVFLGPIIGAFVEPDEKKMSKHSDIQQYSVFAAGPFSNIILAVVALALLSWVFTPLQQSMVEPNGFTFDAYYNDSFPIAKAGVVPGTVINGINGKAVNDFVQFSDEVSCAKPGDELKLSTEKGNYSLILAASPDNPSKGFMGITQIKNEFEVKDAYATGIGNVLYVAADWFNGFLRWLFLLSLGIGLFNLLPLPIVDGGRMVQVSLQRIKGKDKGNNWYGKISLLFLLILVLSLVYPFLSGLLGI
ncbi:site-2 protease family protein [Candidatus Woesearchaeota archaeon]|nr:site-2 protease family protein [Candidatus Woesearchaeota archaeon]